LHSLWKEGEVMIDNWFEEIPDNMEFPGEKLILTLWEARWHGWGRWTIERRAPHAEVAPVAGYWIKEVAHGWWRPPKGWKWHEIEIKDYEGKPMEWVAGRLMSFKVAI
jgi:hypothetical protein